MQQVLISHANRKIKLDLPENWNEVTKNLFRKIFSMLYTFPSPPESTIRVRLAKRLLPSARLFRKMEPAQIVDLTNSVAFLWKTASPVAHINRFRYRFKTYHLPESRLNNITFLEFMYADAYLSNLARATDINNEDLDRLVATLCRPQKWLWWLRKNLPGQNDGDNRQRFNAAIMKRRARRFRKLPVKWKLYVMSFFIACKHEIITDPAYRLVFPKPKQDEFKEETGSWAQLLKDVASTRLYGNYDETAYYNLHTILMNLQDELKRQKAKRKK